jgi:hypothetical protein
VESMRARTFFFFNYFLFFFFFILLNFYIFYYYFLCVRFKNLFKVKYNQLFKIIKKINYLV